MAEADDADTPDPKVEEAIVVEPSVPEPAAEPARAAEPEPQRETRADPAPQPVARRSALWPVLGGVVAAAVGYALAQYVPNGWPIGSSASLETELGAEVQQVKALKDQVLQLSQRLDAASALADRVAKLEAAPAPAAATPDLSGLENRIAALEARPAASGGDGAEVAQLRSDIEALKAKSAGIVSPDIQANIDAKVQETQAKLAAIEDAAKASAAAALARAAIGQIAAALDTGAPYTAAVANLKDTTLPAVLTEHAASGLPSLQSLQADFPQAARSALEAALRANMGQSWGERVANFLRAQTGARALAPRDGNDPDAILSRAEAATAKGDLATALKEISALPPEAIAALSDWQARAQLRLDAETAVQALLSQAG
ncbi:hypothetical protein GC209_06660 [bacterium]|nr:hypothetical protein [bacterium]